MATFLYQYSNAAASAGGRRDNAALRAELANIKRELADTKTELALAERHNALRDNELADTKTELALAERHNALRDNELEDTKTELEVLQDASDITIEDLRDKLHVAESDARAGWDSARSVATDAADLQVTVDDLQATVDALRAANDGLQDMTDELRDMTEAEIQDNERLDRKVVDLKNEISALHEQDRRSLSGRLGRGRSVPGNAPRGSVRTRQSPGQVRCLQRVSCLSDVSGSTDRAG